MAMTKAEMEAHWAAYNAKAAQAQGALNSEEFLDACSMALDALQHIDGLVRYGPNMRIRASWGVWKRSS